MPACMRCGQNMAPDEVHQHAGENICDDCYMDVLSPAKSCDPWAVYTATRLPNQTLNEAQEKILAMIAFQGQATFGEMRDWSGLDDKGLKRELTALRHMELVRAAPDGKGGKVFVSFNSKTLH